MAVIQATHITHRHRSVFDNKQVGWWLEFNVLLIIQTFVTRTVSANILNLRRRQSLGEEGGGSEV